MPDHGRVNRPEWQALWLQYEAVTTPLRAAGLACDIDTCGGQNVMYVDLPDGSHLVIADDHDLPDRLDDVTGWRVTRGHHDNPTVSGLAYDSTAEGEHSKYGADIARMLAAVALFMHQVHDVDTQTAGQVLGESVLRTTQLYAVEFLGVASRHTPAGRILCGPFETHHEAVKEYGWTTHELEKAGWRKVHEQGGTEWPVTAWQRDQAVQLIFVSRVTTS
nr:hypothetical protein OG781_42310 [Streptomyces sp. NBC_00830]